MTPGLWSASNAVARALRGDPFYVAITQDFESDEAGRHDTLCQYFEYSLREGARIGRCKLAPDLGAAVWLLPIHPRDQAREVHLKYAFLKATLGPIGLEHYRRIVEFMHHRSQTMVSETAWYLSIIAVAPDQQGKGLGERLLAETLDEADRAAAPCYLETFAPRTIPFYARLGFTQLAAHREPVTNADYYLMGRKPHTRAVHV